MNAELLPLNMQNMTELHKRLGGSGQLPMVAEVGA